MGFWNNYFKLGIGDKFRDVLGNILLRNKFKDLMEKYQQTSDNKAYKGESQETPPKEQEIQGEPKQDIINPQQNIVDEIRPYAGGKTDNDINLPTEDVQNQEQITQEQPTAIESMLNQRSYAYPEGKDFNTVPIVPHDKRNQVDNVALQMMLDPEKRRQHNEKLRNDVMEFLLYSTRFQNPEKYQDMANMLLTGKTIGDPKIPKFDPKASFTDKNGMLYRYEYDIYQQKDVPVPVTDKFGVQIQTKLPEIRDLSKLHYYKGGNGNAFYKDPDTGEDVDTGVLYEDWNTDYGIDIQKLDLAERKFQQGTTTGTTGNRRSYRGNVTSNETDTNITGIGDGQYLIDVNTGLPLKPTQKTIQTNNFEIAGYNEDGTPQYKPETKTINGYMLNGKFVPASDIDQYITGIGNKKTSAYNKMLLKQYYGIDIGTDKSVNKVYSDRQSWIKGNMKIISDPNSTPEQRQKATQWLKENNKYNKDINVIDDEVYNYIEGIE